MKKENTATKVWNHSRQKTDKQYPRLWWLMHFCIFSHSYVSSRAPHDM